MRAAAFAAVDPVRREVLGRHARRHVEREDHRAFAAGLRHGRLRPGQARHQHHQGEQHEHGRHVAPPPRCPASCRGRGDQAERGQLRSPFRPITLELAVPQHHERDDDEREQHPRPREDQPRRSGRIGHGRRRLRELGDPEQRAHEVLVGRHGEQVEPCRPEVGHERGLPLVGLRAQALLETRVVGVDEDDLAGLGVLDVDHPRRRELELAPVDHLDRHHVVAAGELAEQPLPARLGEEVRHDHDERAPPQDPQRGAQRGAEVGGARARPSRARPASWRGCAARGCGRCRAGSSPGRARRRTARRPGCPRATAAAPPWPRPR